jgi:signal transduction histidine kinase
VENACKFAPPGTRITLDAAASNGWCTVAVSDEGPGFGATSTHPAKGAGLGLQHVRALVQAAGGWVRVAELPVGARVEVGLSTTGWGRAAREA